MKVIMQLIQFISACMCATYVNINDVYFNYSIFFLVLSALYGCWDRLDKLEKRLKQHDTRAN